MGQLGTAFSGASMLFFITYVMQRDEKARALLGLTANINGVASVPLWNRFLKFVERRSLLIVLLTTSMFVHRPSRVCWARRSIAFVLPAGRSQAR